jgi:hypothetical protein
METEIYNKMVNEIERDYALGLLTKSERRRHRFNLWLRKNDLSRLEFYLLMIFAGYLAAQLIMEIF